MASFQDLVNSYSQKLGGAINKVSQSLGNLYNSNPGIKFGTNTLLNTFNPTLGSLSQIKIPQQTMNTVSRNITGNLPTPQQAWGNVSSNVSQNWQNLTDWNKTPNLSASIRDMSTGLPKPIGSVANFALQLPVNNYVAPVMQMPKAIGQIGTGLKQTFAPNPGQSRLEGLGKAGEGALRTAGGVASLIPGIDDLGMAGFNFLKGGNIAADRNAGLGKNLSNAFQTLSGEKQVGLGDTLTTNSTGQMVGNLAELPFMIFAPGLIKGNKEAVIKRADEILKDTNTIKSLIHFKNIDVSMQKDNRQLPLEYYTGYASTLRKTAEKIIPKFLNTNEMRRLEKTNVKQWEQVVVSKLEDSLVSASEIKKGNFDWSFGLNTKPMKKLEDTAQSTLHDIKPVAKLNKEQLRAISSTGEDVTNIDINRTPTGWKGNPLYDNGGVSSKYELLNPQTGELYHFNSSAEAQSYAIDNPIAQKPIGNSKAEIITKPLYEKPNVAQAPVNDIPSVKPPVIEPPQVTGNEQIRGFADTVKQDLTIPKEVRDFAETLTYKPLSNKAVLDRVSEIVKQGDAQAINFAKTGDTTEANATALVMIRKLLAENRHTEAQDLIAAVSPRFTKQGQQIQILSQFGKLKPEGAIKFAQSIVDKANKENPALKLKLTEQNIQALSEKATAIQGLPEGSRERLVATAELMKEFSTIVPPSIGQKLATVQTMAQLLNPKTAIRNIIGNGIFSGLENVSDVVGTGIDKGVSLVTGQRSKVLPSALAQVKGGIRGGVEGYQDVMKGIDTSGGMTGQFEVQNGPTFTRGPLSTLEKAMKLELGVPDRVFSTAAYEGSLNNQMRAAGVTEPTKQMIEVATHDAQYRTFQDNSTLAQIFGGAKKLLNKIGTPDGKFGLGDFILKYPKTPANIISRGIDYTPAGFIKGVYEVTKPLLMGQPFNQKTFVEDLSRAMVGTGTIAGAYMLAKNGVINGKSPKDYDVSATQQSAGGGQFKINVDALKRFTTSGGQPQQQKPGDTLVSYDWAQPTSLTFSMGADMALNGTGKNAISDALDTSTQTITGQPLVQGMTQFGKDIQDKGVATALTKSALAAPSGFIPSLSNAVASLLDTTSRSTYDPNKLTEAKNKVVSRIPLLRNTLQPSVDVFGNEKRNYESTGLQRVVDVLFNPAFVTTIKDNPSAQEVLDIYSRSGETQQAPRVADKKVKINGKDIQLTPTQYTTYQKYIGTKTQQVFDALVTNSTFMKANDEDKAKLMASALSDINSAAKIELFGNQPKTVSNSVKQMVGGTNTNMVSFTKEGNLKLSTQLQYPKLTGMKELDKKALSNFYGQITTAANDILYNYQNGTISASDAESQLQQLKAIKTGYSSSTSTKKPKKLKAIKPIKVKIPKMKTIKVKGLKLAKPKTAKVKITKMKSIKLRKTV